MTASSSEKNTSSAHAGSGEESLTEGSSLSSNGLTTPEEGAVVDAIRPLLKQPESPKYPEAKFELVDRHIDEPRSLRVVVIGAGLSGVTAGVLLPAKVPGIKLTIFEKNADVVCDKPTLVYLVGQNSLTTLSIIIGRHLVRERLPGRQVRHPSPCLPDEFLAQYPVE